MANVPTFECPIVQDAPDAVDNTCICFRHHGVECGFDFTNDTGGTIQAGNNIKLNCFNHCWFLSIFFHQKSFPNSLTNNLEWVKMYSEDLS